MALYVSTDIDHPGAHLKQTDMLCPVDQCVQVLDVMMSHMEKQNIAADIGNDDKLTCDLQLSLRRIYSNKMADAGTCWCYRCAV